MHIVHVFIHVKPEFVQAFVDATKANASESIREPGIARFDFVQQTDAPNHFVLVEVYRTSDDQLRHRETAHYQTWRETVADMMAEPRTAYRYTNILPADEGWG
jgi:(4S)-4-hydroxy-5-phosphonooxypentane-2,3-dione isomerase